MKSKNAHAALKVGRAGESKASRRLLKLSIAFLILACALYGIWTITTLLRARWIELSVVHDHKKQIAISATPHIPEEIAREWFGLTNNSNLATIEFMELRRKVLKEHPIVRELNVTLHMPDHLEISMEERKPIARINIRESSLRKGNVTIPRATWDVVDADGMVFEFSPRDSKELPVIREKMPSAKRGETLTGRAHTALRLVELTTVRGIASPVLTEISTDNETYLRLTTRDDDTLHIDWRIIDKPTDPDQPILTKILRNFDNLKKQNLYPATKDYFVPEPNRITVQSFDF